MAELHETRMGKTLIDSTFPKIAKELKRIADALELRNQVDALIRAKREEYECSPENILEEEGQYNHKICKGCCEVSPVCYCGERESNNGKS